MKSIKFNYDDVVEYVKTEGKNEGEEILGHPQRVKVSQG